MLTQDFQIMSGGFLGPGTLDRIGIVRQWSPEDQLSIDFLHSDQFLRKRGKGKPGSALVKGGVVLSQIFHSDTFPVDLVY